jgi:hypothetical protein
MKPWLISSDFWEEHFKYQSKNPQPFPTEQCQHNRRQTLHFNVITLHWSQRRAISFSPLCVRSIHTHTFILSLEDILSSPRVQIEWESGGSILWRVKKVNERKILPLAWKIPGARFRGIQSKSAINPLLLRRKHVDILFAALFSFTHSLSLSLSLMPAREVLRVSGLNSCPSSRFISVC